MLAGGVYYKSGVGTVPQDPPYNNNQAGGVAVDTQGYVYVEDVVHGVVYRLPPAGQSFLPANAGSTSYPVSVTFTFDSGGTIGTPRVVTQGTPSLDFTDAGTGTCNTNGPSHTYSQNDTCTVNITFPALLRGRRFRSLSPIWILRWAATRTNRSFPAAPSTITSPYHLWSHPRSSITWR